MIRIKNKRQCTKLLIKMLKFTVKIYSSLKGYFRFGICALANQKRKKPNTGFIASGIDLHQQNFIKRKDT